MDKTTIAGQVIQNQDKDGMLRRALERIIQLYTDKSHFVYELLQNAEDCGASKIKFHQYADRLEVIHDGRPFSLNNLQGLCDIGKSDKSEDLNQIGEFGVGFKSVFGICETVELYSHPRDVDYKALEELYKEKGIDDIDVRKEHPYFSIRIIDFTRPEDIEDREVPDSYTTKFVFPYSVGFSFSGFDSVEKLNEVLSKRLQNLGITTLLFMKNLKSIDYEITLPNFKKSGSYQLDKTIINNHCALVSAIGETDNKKDEENKKGKKDKKEEDVFYLVFTRPVQGMQEGRTIDIAFSLKVKSDGKYEFISSKHPFISVYFPTETESKLKFIVQGPYRTTPNRSSVPADDKDNIALARQTAELLRDSVIELRDEGKLDLSLLKILPIDEDVFYSAPLFKHMFAMTRDMMQVENVLPCKNGTYASAKHVKIARGADFANLFTDELLTELIDDGREYHWLPTSLTETSNAYKTLYGFLTNTLGIEVIRPENLRDNFNENKEFLTKRDDEWLIKLYNMYATVSAAFSKERGGSKNMLTAEFIKTSTGQFVAPYRKIDGKLRTSSFMWRGYEDATYLPNVFLPSKNIEDTEDIYFVDEYIYEQCKSFFKEILSLEKPNEYEFFIRDFKRRNEGKMSISDEQHIIDVRKLLRFRQNPDYEDEVDKLIKDYVSVKCNKAGKSVYVNPRRERVYFSVNSEGMSIEQYFNHIAVYAYVDIDFYESADISAEQLRVFCVRDSITKNEFEITGEYYTGNPGHQPGWNTRGDFRWKLTLESLPEVLEYISGHPNASDSMVKSNFIFRFLMNNASKLTGIVYIGGNTPNIYNAVSEIVATLRKEESKYKYYGSRWDGKWLYTESFELVSQSEITKRDLNTQLYGDIVPNSALYEILGFKKGEADYLEEAIKDYDKLSEERQNQYLEIAFKRRYGISITEFEKQFSENINLGDGKNLQTIEESNEFPSSNVKDWDSLHKHVAKVLHYAKPVKYENIVRKIRTSLNDDEIRTYLKNMYKVKGVYKFACQMCHKTCEDLEKGQIGKSPKLELDAMNLCLCPNCATKFRKMQVDNHNLKSFLEDIENLSESEIENAEPVEVAFGNEVIWFTQTHIAEIRELIILQKTADEYEDVDNEQIETDDNENQEIFRDFPSYVSQPMDNQVVYEGCHITYRKMWTGEEYNNQLQSVKYPLHKAFLGCSVGDVIKFRGKEYEIIEIKN